MSLPELLTNLMHTQTLSLSLQNASSNYDPKNQSIFSSYSIDLFRSRTDPTDNPTPVNFVRSNNEVTTDPVNVRTQQATLHNEANSSHPISLTDSRPYQSNSTPVTTGENSRPGVLDDRKFLYTNINTVEFPLNNNRLNIDSEPFKLDIDPKLSLYDHFNRSTDKKTINPLKNDDHHSLNSDDQKSINSISISKNTPSSSNIPNKSIRSSHSDIYISTNSSYDNHMSVPVPVSTRSLSMARRYSNTSHVRKPGHVRSRSCDNQSNQYVNTSKFNKNSLTINGSNQALNQVPQNFFINNSNNSGHSLPITMDNYQFDNSENIKKRRFTLMAPLSYKRFIIFGKPKKTFPAYIKAIKALEEMQFNEAINLFSLVLVKYPQSYSVRCDRAYASYQIEDWDRAMDDLNHAISKKPKKARAYSLRGELYRLISMYEKSLIDLNKSLKLQINIFSLRSRAEVYIAIGRYNDAIIDLNSALEIKPKNISSMIRRSKVYCLLGKYHDAITDLNIALELDPSNNMITASILSNRGEISRLMGRNDLALADLNSSLLLIDDILTLERRGNLYISLGNHNNALTDFERILQLNPKYFSAHKNIANILFKFKIYEKSLLHLNIALQLKSDDFSLLKIRGLIYQTIGRYNDAIKDYNFALNLNPNDLDLFKYRGETFRLIRNFDKSLKDFTKVLELDPKNVYALTRRGEIFRMLKQGTNALRDLDEAIRLDPDNLMARESRGAMNRTLRRYEEALRDLDDAIFLNQNSTFALSNRAAVFHMLRRCNEALFDLKKALKIDPKHVFALETRSALYNFLERYNDALADSNKVLELDPKNVWALTYRGEALHGLKREKEALQDLNKVLENFPDWEYPLSLRGAIYRSLNMNKEALSDLERALNHTKDKAFNIDYETKALCNRGSVLFRLGHYNDALNDFNKVLLRDPTNSFALKERGAVYEALGKKDKELMDINNLLITEPEKS
ncbi:10804_t:CDS:2 [Scutellospora calospora]|uniref:10804_t:CDS:1 n=1 Tax=Scutellospora calospora TaxID=85575 RepID=A0ACA9L9D2_9GLOM|nr:10804_t:CDS:2 [Scutellospora calospora]